MCGQRQKSGHGENHKSLYLAHHFTLLFNRCSKVVGGI